jgi:hypothetical protein
MHFWRGTVCRATMSAGFAAVLVAPLVVSAVTSSSSAESTVAPIAIRGSVAGVESLDDASVKVQIAPDQQILAGLEGTASIHNSEVPEAMVETSGNNYVVRVDPALVPVEDISSTGVVTFEVYVQDPNGSTFGMTTASVRAVLTENGQYAWTDPTGPTVDLESYEGAARASTEARSAFARSSTRGKAAVVMYSRSVRAVTANVARPSVRGVICDSAGCAPSKHGRAAHKLVLAGSATGGRARADGDDGETEGGGTIDAPVIFEQPVASGGCPTGGPGDVYTSTKRNVSTTIGTAYPVGNDVAWMEHTSGSSAEFVGTYGIAWDGIGYFQQSGSKSVEKGAGFTWDGKKYERSFRVGVVYQKVDAMYDRCYGEPYYVKWVPVGYSGSFGENAGLTRPGWNNCVTIGSTGTWWRTAATGSSYSLSTGVKFAGVIGIDMSSKRAYNAEAKLAYHVGLAGRRMCGSNDRPGMAGKVMERGLP